MPVVASSTTRVTREATTQRRARGRTGTDDDIDWVLARAVCRADVLTLHTDPSSDHRWTLGLPRVPVGPGGSGQAAAQRQHPATTPLATAGAHLLEQAL